MSFSYLRTRNVCVFEVTGFQIISRNLMKPQKVIRGTCLCHYKKRSD